MWDPVLLGQAYILEIHHLISTFVQVNGVVVDPNANRKSEREEHRERGEGEVCLCGLQCLPQNFLLYSSL